ncbi:hypothetical protein B382_24208 [Stutzerimonas stutzeri B1SMN1]|nr:hypothetical protein B382_24208 [Stutzerimonas stutzeri B1SMN1]
MTDMTVTDSTPDNDQSSDLAVFDDIYESPTISRLPSHQRPKPSTVCESCPAAVWMVQKNQLQCYCRVTHVMIYSKEEKTALTACDGRDMAIEQLLAKQAAADARE